MDKSQTKKELTDAGLQPIKHRGQNFLVSEEIINKIIAAAIIKRGEMILEVGPGTGNLTKSLIDSGAEVLAIEKDEKLSQLLITNFQFPISNKNLKIINEDILIFDETEIKKHYRVIANIPYYLTGPLIQKFLFSKNRPTEMILMVQKEVGERITAQPPKMNYLAALIQSESKAKILFYVSKENFWPQPKVDSVIISIIPQKTRVLSGLKDFLKIIFKQPRQTLFNNLRKNSSIEKEKLEKKFDELGLGKNIRAQNLNMAQLRKIFTLIRN